jgi:uncharacterized integral membrane protein (TIGR00698 family)
MIRAIAGSAAVRRIQVGSERRAQNLRWALFAAALLFCVSPWASPPLALTAGLTLALLVEHPFPQAGKRIALLLLKACVVLLGFGMNQGIVLRAGADGLLFAAVGIAVTLLLGVFVGRRLRIHDRTSALISAGTAICGGSAIAAVGSVVEAEEAEMTVALGTVALLNALALYLFPLIGHALHLSQTQFGTWAGVAIHDISSVVGAASGYGPSALQTATAVKLSRTLWIVPVAFGAALALRVPCGSDPARAAGPRSPRVPVPWFIGLFLLASLARTAAVPGVDRLAPAIGHLAATGMTLALFLVGAGLSRQALRTVGWRPLLLGLMLWVCISAGALLVILRTIS